MLYAVSVVFCDEGTMVIAYVQGDSTEQVAKKLGLGEQINEGPEYTAFELPNQKYEEFYAIELHQIDKLKSSADLFKKLEEI